MGGPTNDVENPMCAFKYHHTLLCRKYMIQTNSFDFFVSCKFMLHKKVRFSKSGFLKLSQDYLCTIFVGVVMYCIRLVLFTDLGAR